MRCMKTGLAVLMKRIAQQLTVLRNVALAQNDTQAETMQAGVDQVLVLGYPGNFLTVGQGFFLGLRFDNPESRTGKWMLTGCPINCGMCSALGGVPRQ